MAIEHVAFLGLGVMGGPMTANLAKQGYALQAWNRTRDRVGVDIARAAGATIADTIAQAVADAEAILTCLGDVPDVEEVLLGAGGVAESARSGALVVDLSTIGTPAARHLGEQLQQRGLRFLDAPVSGGDVGAQKGTLTIMVGGSEADFQECLPLFEAMGKNIHLCGAIGSGQAVKMCNQVLCAMHMVGLCEAMHMARQQGIDPNLIVEVCSTGAAGSWALSNLGPKAIAADYAPGFTIAHLLKDLRLVQETLAAAGESLPGVELADRLYKLVAALDEGHGAVQGTQALARAYPLD